MNVPQGTNGRLSPHDLHDLFTCADEACARAEGGGLAEIAHLLGLCVAPPDQFDLLEIERLAVLDVGTASGLWLSIRPGLRRKLFDHDGAVVAGHHSQH